MPLIEMEDGRVEPELAQNPDPTNAQDQLLPQPVLAVASVEDVRDVARPRRVALDLRVEQVERDAPDPRAPDAEPDGNEVAAVVRELDHRSHRHELEGQPVRVVPREALDLPVVLVQPLPEVAAPIEEADAD